MTGADHAPTGRAGGRERRAGSPSGAAAVCYGIRMSRWRWTTVFVMTLTIVLASCREVRGATTWHVDARNAGAQDGTTRKPRRSLQEAIDKAHDGDTIKVATGVYGPIKVSDKALTLLGGFAGATKEAYEKGSAGDFTVADRDANVTRIAGTGTGVVVVLEVAGHSRIESFYISGGAQGLTSDGWPFDKQEPVIHHNVIEDNKSDVSVEGGAIWCKTNIVITNNIIRKNQAGRGAGITCWASKVHIEDNVIEENVGVGDHGGGLYVASPDLVIARNLFRKNETGKGTRNGVGGAMVVLNKGTNARITENIITQNKAPGRASGIFVDDEAHATIAHNLIYANECGYRGGAAITVDGLDEEKLSKAEIIHNTVADHPCPGEGNSVQVQNADVTVSDNIFWNNGDDFFTFEKATLKVSHSIAKETSYGEHNLAVDPLFADPKNGDYHLRSKVGRYDQGEWVVDDVDSPAIDAGNPALAADGEPAPNGSRVNLGAYGNTSQASKSAKSGAQTASAPASSGGIGPGLLGAAAAPPPTGGSPGARGCGGCSLGERPGRLIGLSLGALALLFLARRRA